MRIEIIIPIDSETQEVYHFNTFDLTAVFIYYAKQIKPKGKRKWTNINWWDKYNTRDSRIPEPELTEDVKSKVLSKAKESITVKTWAEYKPENN